jgi:hypothetical protein
MNTETAMPESGAPRRTEGRFYTGMAIAAIAIAIAGFGLAAVDTDIRKGPLTLWLAYTVPSSVRGSCCFLHRPYSSLKDGSPFIGD